MEREKYEISNGFLHLIDSEMELEIKEPFDLPLVPLLQEKHSALDDVEVIWSKDDKGRFEGAYLKKEGLFHGQHVQFYPCGNKKGEAFYFEGKLHGPSLFHSQEGTLLSSTWFYQGVPIGKSRQFYNSGKPYSVQRYKKGKLHGKQEYFYENSTLKTSLFYEEGDLHGEVELFWASGLMKRRSFFEKGLRHGEDFIWNESGILIDYGNYKKGRPLGKQQKSYPSGVLKEEHEFHTEEKISSSKWDEKGEMIYKGVHLDEDFFEETFKDSLGETVVRKGKWNGRQVVF